MVVCASVFADGFVVGTEITYGKDSSDISASVPGASASVSTDTKSIGFAVKSGYQFDAVRVLGVVTSEKYKDDVIVFNEGSAVSIGAEVDYMIDNLFVGGMLASGSKDFSGVDIDFTDVGVRAGGLFDLSEGVTLEAGIQYKKRGYDSYVYEGVTIGLDEKIVGLFLGVSFNL